MLLHLFLLKIVLHKFCEIFPYIIIMMRFSNIELRNLLEVFVINSTILEFKKI